MFITYRKRQFMKASNTISAILFVLTFFIGITYASDLKIGPKEGSKIGEITGIALNGTDFSLAKMVEKGSVVLVMLRGYPGKQCPVCSTQVAGYIAKADAFKQERDTPVVFIYPGKVDNLEKRASEFTAPLEKEVDLPGNFTFLLDQDFNITKQLNLRWDKAGETAYPAAFVIDHDGYIQFAKVSDNHGDRATADEILEFLEIIH